MRAISIFPNIDEELTINVSLKSLRDTTGCNFENHLSLASRGRKNSDWKTLFQSKIIISEKKTPSGPSQNLKSILGKRRIFLKSRVMSAVFLKLVGVFLHRDFLRKKISSRDKKMGIL